MATLFDTAELLLVQKTIKTGSSTWSLLNSMLDKNIRLIYQMIYTVLLATKTSNIQESSFHRGI